MAQKILGEDDLPILELTDEEMEATGYDIAVSVSDNEMRIQHCNDLGVISYLVLDAAGAYELAHRILRGYDKLEGL